MRSPKKERHNYIEILENPFHNDHNDPKHSFWWFFVNKMCFRSFWIFLRPKWTYPQIFGLEVKIRGCAENQVIFENQTEHRNYTHPNFLPKIKKMWNNLQYVYLTQLFCYFFEKHKISRGIGKIVVKMVVAFGPYLRILAQNSHIFNIRFLT